MYDHDPIQTEARRARRRARLGPNPRCLLCGYGEPEALTVADGEVRRWVLEEHHVAGRKNDPDLTVLLCLNCHRVITEACRRAGVQLNPPATLLHRVIALLRGIAAFLPDLAERCHEVAQMIESLIERLDEAFPPWRTLLEAT